MKPNESKISIKVMIQKGDYGQNEHVTAEQSIYADDNDDSIAVMTETARVAIQGAITAAKMLSEEKRKAREAKEAK